MGGWGGCSLVPVVSTPDELTLVCQVVGERSEAAATKMHLWLERTAFYKVPKSHQDEVADECLKPFEQVCHSRFHICLCPLRECHCAFHLLLLLCVARVHAQWFVVWMHLC